MAALKEAVAESNDKFYDMGFADVKNSSEPIMVESRWLFVNSLGLLEDSAFREPKQVPDPEEFLRPPSRPLLRMEKKIASL